MTRLAIIAVLVGFPALAETCRAPNVARSVMVWPKSVIVHYPTGLTCPAEGVCWREKPYVTMEFGREEVECLTPGQVRDAEDRVP